MKTVWIEQPTLFSKFNGREKWGTIYPSNTSLFCGGFHGFFYFLEVGKYITLNTPRQNQS